MANIVIKLNNWELPEQGELVKTPGLKSADVETLNGAIYTDFISRYRVWSIKWPYMTKAEYEALEAVWNSQFNDESYPILSIPYYGVLGPAKLEINEQDIRWDGNQVINVQITLREQYAIS